MTTLTAGLDGKVSGTFTIPAGVPSGSKRVEFLGKGGSYGTATFVGEASITTNNYQRVTTINTQRYDPLAQTFTLNQARQITGVEVFVTAKTTGTNPLVLQIRDTAVGFPTQRVLAETRLEASAIAVGQYNRFVFATPLLTDPNVEYAFVLLTDSPDYAVGIAELGKFDSNRQQWVTSQPYTVGVLLSSSNASTWTPHQDRDLTFRLLTAKYTEAAKTVAIGSIALSNTSDLMLLAATDSPTANVRAEYELVLPDGTVIPVSDSQPIRLASKTSGNAVVRAKLKSDVTLASQLNPGTLVAAGEVTETATYATTAIPGSTSCKVRVVYDANIPAGASVVAHVQAVGATTWTQIALDSSAIISETLREYTHIVSALNAPSLRVRLTLTGTATARPRVRNLRVMVV